MDPLGSELKQAREASGVSLRDMATRTKISVTALEALERGDVSRLPGGIFGRSFVRAYAAEVGLDPDTIVERFVELLEKSERDAAERRRAAQPEISLDDRQFLERQRRALLALRVLVVVAVIAALALVAWQVRRIWPNAQSSGTSSAPSADVSVPLETPAATPPAAVDPSVNDFIPQPPPQPQIAEATPADGGAVAPVVIELLMSGECWLAVSLDGQPETARLYRAGERVRYEMAQQILLDAGNAGVVGITINGRAAKPLGGAGAHVRTRITRDNLNGFF